MVRQMHLLMVKVPLVHLVQQPRMLLHQFAAKQHVVLRAKIFRTASMLHA